MGSCSGKALSKLDYGHDSLYRLKATPVPYCIYTDEDVADQEGNFDHIIPLSLGGRNDFCVWADLRTNSRLGHEVDGKVANDFLVMLARRNADARGHSNEPPVPVWKRTTLEGRHVQLKLAADKLEAWDPRTKSVIPECDLVGKPMSSRVFIDKFASLRFASKVALAGGYFVYGNSIRGIIDCDELRYLMDLDPEKARVDPRIHGIRTKICDRFHPDANGASSEGSTYRFLSEYTGRTVFIAVPHEAAVSFHVGVLGMYMASIICPAKPHNLPNDGLHDLGHVVLLSPGNFEQMSLRSFALAARAAISSSQSGKQRTGQSFWMRCTNLARRLWIRIKHALELR